MADAKLSALTELAGTDAVDADLFYVDDISVTTGKKITLAGVKVAVGITTGTTSTTFTFDGSGGSTGSLTLTWQKIGNWVTLNIPAAQATTGTGSTILASDTALAAAVRPTTNQDCPCNDMRNNGGATSDAGVIRIGTGGTINIYRNGLATAYTNAASGGTHQNVSVTYFIG